MPSPEQTQMERQHIFAVNGSPDLLDVIRTLFQDENYNVTTTNFIPDTFDQIATAAPAVLIVDLVRGEEAGFNLLEQLSREDATRDLPIIVVSTSQAMIDEARAHPAQYGRRRFLRKPFDIDDLLTMVTDLVGRA
ncbi:MAG: hypothetical protein AVDCRST_MAG70-1582 [uncultured Thermomicrobiales bacterium]|uniref:Response regulatory domain-containing protein n=1 Tax=uncultured Thermomicrobiales bacterium TaxID=1645740 RepID=A0A6J4UWJ6_9BACT|nr:MAG: hypothetical protein AVDCRST_MAG70-1582 [uncultured Thermomicrobiales bacterium]